MRNFLRGPAKFVTIRGEFGDPWKVQIAAGTFPDYPGVFSLDFIQANKDGTPGLKVISICTTREMLDRALDAVMGKRS